MLAPFANGITAESAERIAHYKVDAETQARIDELAEKANEGLLSDAERSEYHGFVEAIDRISVLRFQARQLLRRRNAS
jgi:hypothetical protein